MRVSLFAAAICAAIVGAYFWLEPSLQHVVPFGRRTSFVIILVILLLCARYARNVLASLTAGLLTLVAIELLFLVLPAHFPDNLRMFVESGAGIVRHEIVERLPHSPFAKPKPNVLVRIPGYYGPKDQFEYEWRADFRGFKNLPDIANLPRFKAVAVGDSFTEGMGVRIADVWTSRLSAKGHPTYNLGIQGYSPTQFLGAWEHFGKQLAAQWVIIGMLGNVHERELQYLGENFPSQAIQRLVEQDDLNKQNTLYLETRDGYRYPTVIWRRYRFLTSAIVALTRRQLEFALYFDPAAGVANPQDDARFASDKDGLGRYRSEIETARLELVPSTLAASAAWKAALARLDDLSRSAHASGARVLLLFFPNRGTAYSSQLPHNASDLVQARELAQFARAKNIDFLDLTPALTKSGAQRPYLEIDGHPSPVGHEIIATEIARHIEQRQ